MTLRFCTALFCVVCFAEVVQVRYPEGELHGFLALRTLEGETLADGDLIQTARAGAIRTRLVFHFRDGSVHDETAVFTQRREFRLVRYHLIQRGPAFRDAIDMAIDCATGKVTVHYADHGEQKTITENIVLPDDLANGMVPIILKNLKADGPLLKLSMLVATPKPRMVKLAIAAAGEDPFSVGRSGRKARQYVMKVELGGVAGVVAPMVGKQPPDTHMWVLEGEAPAFVKLEGPLAEGTPVWRIEMQSPVFPRAGN